MIERSVESLMKHVNRTEAGCWEWSGARTAAGYGNTSIRVDGRAQQIYAHRLSYELSRGPIPVGEVVRHKCDNPPCVNPDHLEIGTQADNIRDMHERGRFVPVTKLTAAQVQEIRSEPTWKGMLAHLSEKHGVSHHYISKLRSGRHWKELDRPEGEGLVRAADLAPPLAGRPRSVLSDGSSIVSVSVQPDWVYVRAVRADGKLVRRRYSHDRMVRVVAQ